MNNRRTPAALMVAPHHPQSHPVEALEKSPRGSDWSMWLFQLKNAGRRLMVACLKLPALTSVLLVARKPLTSHSGAQHDISTVSSLVSPLMPKHSQNDRTETKCSRQERPLGCLGR